MTTQPSTSIPLVFYGQNGVQNTDYTGQLNDNRDSVVLTLRGNSSNVLTAQLYVDSADATNAANLKTYKLRMDCDNFVGTSSTVASNDNHYAFVDGERYALKIKLVLNSVNYPTLYAKFVVDQTQTPSYDYLFRTTPDVIDSSLAAVTNPNDVENGSTISILAPMQYAKISVVNTIDITQELGSNLFSITATGYNNGNPVPYTIPAGKYNKATFANAVSLALNQQFSVFADLSWEVTYDGDKLQLEFYEETIGDADLVFTFGLSTAVFGASSSTTTISNATKKVTMTNNVATSVYPPTSVNLDSRVPDEMMFTFDQYDPFPNDSNLEALSPYSVVMSYDGINNKYDLPNNQLVNDNKYALSITAIYGDGYTTSITLVEPVYVVAAPSIQFLEAYGLNEESTGAGVSTVSTIMNLILSTEQLAKNVHRSNDKIIFNLSQLNTVYYRWTVDVNHTNNPPSYHITKDTGTFTKPNLNPVSQSNGAFLFDVTAQRSYDAAGTNTFLKTSVKLSGTFSTDIISLAAFQIENAWIQMGVVSGATSVAAQQANLTRSVQFTTVLTQNKWNSIPEAAVSGQFTKTDFYGSGITTGLYQDLDTNGTSHKFEISKDGGATFSPVTSLLMKQSSITASSTPTDIQNEYVEFYWTAETLTNSDGIYPNLPYSSQVLGSQQPPILFIVPCDPVAPVPGIEVANGTPKNLTDAEMTSVKADSNLAMITVLPRVDGWTIKNPAAVNGTVPKVNLYFYDNKVADADQTSSNAFKLSQASGLGLYAVFNQNSGAKQYPFFVVYTTRTATANKATWYKSKVLFGAVADANPINNGLTLVYTGTDDGLFRPDIPSSRRIKYDYKPTYSNANAGYNDELVNLLSLQTSSNANEIFAGDFDFRLLETGIVTNHALVGKLSLKYQVYPENNVVIAVSVIAPAGNTKPLPTRSNSLKLTNKVNQSRGSLSSSETPIFGIQNDTLTIKVDDNFATSNDYMTGVMFSSNLNYPNNSLYAPSSADSNIYTFNIVNPAGRRGPLDPCIFNLAYVVDDVNGDIIGPSGLPNQIQLNNKPLNENDVLENFTYKTMNDNDESSCNFDVTYVDTDAFVVGYNVYFYTQSGSVQSTQVATVNRGSTDSQNVTIVLSDKSFFSSWVDLTPGVIQAVPCYLDNGVRTENANTATSSTMYNVLKITAVTSATISGGVVESSSGTFLKWDVGGWKTSVYPGYAYNLLSDTIDVSSSVTLYLDVVSDSLIYNIANPSVAEHILVLKKQVTIAAASKTWYGPTTTLTFNSVSVDTTTMALAFQRGSNNLQLLASHAPYVVNGLATNLIVEAVELVDTTGTTTALTQLNKGASQPANIQPPNVSNTYSLAPYSLGSDLKLKMAVKAGVKVGYVVGGNPSESESFSTYLSLLAPSKHYIVANSPSVTVGTTYTVNNNGQIVLPFSMNANGMTEEGFSGVTGIIIQDSSLTDAADPNSGKGGTAIVSFGPSSNYPFYPGISVVNGGTPQIQTAAAMTAVKADSNLAMITTTADVNGWTIKNPAAVNGTVPKVNLYFYDNKVADADQTSSNAFTLSQASGLGLYAVFNHNSGAKKYPFFVAYTTKVGLTDNKASWYRSKVLFGDLANTNPINDGLTLAYTGTDDGLFRPDIPSSRRIKYDYKPTYSNANAGYNDEFVNLLSLQTSSNATEISAGDFDFQLLETGIVTSNTNFGKLSLEYQVYYKYSRTFSYNVGPDANLDDETDYLAAFENRTTTPDDFNVDTIESGVFTLSLGSLTAADESKLICPTTGLDPSKPIQLIVIANTRLGTAANVNTLNYAIQP